jgi:hypothetical protein
MLSLMPKSKVNIRGSLQHSLGKVRTEVRTNYEEYMAEKQAPFTSFFATTRRFVPPPWPCAGAQPNETSQFLWVKKEWINIAGRSFGSTAPHSIFKPSPSLLSSSRREYVLVAQQESIHMSRLLYALSDVWYIFKYVDAVRSSPSTSLSLTTRFLRQAGRFLNASREIIMKPIDRDDIAVSHT